MSWEAIAGFVAIAAVFLMAFIGWAQHVNNKLTEIGVKLDGMNGLHAKAEEENANMWKAINRHGDRLTRLETAASSQTWFQRHKRKPDLEDSEGG